LLELLQVATQAGVFEELAQLGQVIRNLPARLSKFAAGRVLGPLRELLRKSTEFVWECLKYFSDVDPQLRLLLIAASDLPRVTPGGRRIGCLSAFDTSTVNIANRLVQRVGVPPEVAFLGHSSADERDCLALDPPRSKHSS